MQAIPNLAYRGGDELRMNHASPMPCSKLCNPEFKSPDIVENMRCDCGMWQSQRVCAFLQLCYDPDTGERTGVAFNDIQARLFGMQSEELLTRFASHDVPLPFAPQDLLLLLTDTVLNGCADGERFIRIIGSSGLPVLVCVSTNRSYNHAAQLIAVSLDPEEREISRQSRPL